MYVYDGLFSCSEATNDDEDGVGSFRHYMGRKERMKPDGTYTIYAKVQLPDNRETKILAENEGFLSRQPPSPRRHFAPVR